MKSHKIHPAAFWGPPSPVRQAAPAPVGMCPRGRQIPQVNEAKPAQPGWQTAGKALGKYEEKLHIIMGILGYHRNHRDIT